MQRLFEMLTELSVDPFKQAELAAGQKTAGQEGLSVLNQELLERMRKGEHDALIANGAWNRGALWIDPGPDPLPDPDVP